MESVLLYIGGILAVAVGLAASIALHEIGHLVPAKRFGVKVFQYMIGFGPTIWSRRRGETEYGFKALPLGGYISMAGMYPPAREGERARTASTGFLQGLAQDARETQAAQIAPGEEHRTFSGLPVWKRIVIMLGGPFMNLLIAVVLAAVVLCGFGIPQTTTTIGSVSECVVPAGSTRTECAADDPAAPAAEAGILPGDTVVAVEGETIETWAQMSAMIRDSPDEPLAFTVERDGERLELVVTPLLSERAVTDANGVVQTDAAGDPVTQEVGFAGVGGANAIVRQPATEVLPAVGDNIVAVGRIIVTLPQRMIAISQAAFGGGERDPNGPLSVVGVGRLAGEISSIDTIPIEQRVASVLQMIGSLNVALFVFNLIPLLPLDGGHVAGALLEAIRRRLAKLFGRPDPGPLDTARLIPFTLGIAAVIGVMTLLLVYADIVNPISIL